MIEQIYLKGKKDSYENVENKLYKIFCKNCKLVLRPEVRQKKEENDEIKIMGCIDNNKSIKLLWLIKSVKEKKQIINFYTNLAIDTFQEDVKLQRIGEKGSRFQLEKLQKNRTFQDYTLFRIKDYNNLYLTLDGTLEVARPDQTDQSQIYYFQEVDPDLYTEFKQTTIIVNPQRKKCLQARKQLKSSGPVFLSEFSQKFSQRWCFDPPLQNSKDEKYSIINMHSNLRLWYDKNNQLIESQNKDRIWQWKHKTNNLGQLYCHQIKKYLNRVEEDTIRLENHSNGTRWELLKKIIY